MKKVLSLLLALTMVLGMVCTTALAGENDDNPGSTPNTDVTANQTDTKETGTTQDSNTSGEEQSGQGSDASGEEQSGQGGNTSDEEKQLSQDSNTSDDEKQPSQESTTSDEKQSSQDSTTSEEKQSGQGGGSENSDGTEGGNSSEGGNTSGGEGNPSNEPVAVTGVTLDKETVEIKVGDTVTLTATVEPGDATDKTVTWTSSDEAVATVADGVVTGVKAGTATITATAGEGEEAPKAECTVTVTEEQVIDWNEKTKTLTITGVKKLDQTAALAYVKELSTKAADVKAVVISGVDAIASYAFHKSVWPALETVTIDGVTTIGNHAFSGLPALNSVTLTNVGTVESNGFSENKALTVLSLENIDSVGAEAFRQCSALTSLTMKDVESFGRSAFSYCTGLTELNLDGSNGNLGSMGATMFYGCTGLTSVTLKNVDAVPVQMFNGCTALKTVTIENVSSIGQQAFYDCKGLETVTMDKVTTIGGTSIFQKCTRLNSLTLKNVETIGEQAFVSATMKNVTMDNVGTIGKNAFASCKNLESVTMTGSTDTIGQYAFYNCTALNTVTMGEVRFIDNYAFWNCTGLTTIDSLSNVTERIGGFAFYGCEKLTGLTVADLTKMGFIGSNDEIMKRVQAILAGRFQLDDATQIAELTRESGWPAGDVGKSGNWDKYDNGTQLMEQARWQNAADGVAQVKVDAYYTGEKQMDYIFVADLSASMAQLGNPDDDNARFYDMQSKLLDMTGKLLGTDGYDCQVAIVVFGGKHQGDPTRKSSGFLTTATEARNYILGLEPLNENTDYKLGLNETLKVLESHGSGRSTTVIFLSDGAPTRDGENKITNLPNYNKEIEDLAGRIKGAGAQIYGVLHSPVASSSTSAMRSMEAVCGKGNVYKSTDTESFGNAMNAAFTAAYGNNTVTVPVNAVQFDVSGLSATAGEVSYSDGVITWTLNGMPFTQHTLTYNLTLKSELANRVGTYTYRINYGPARFGENGASVDLDTAANKLSLTRTVNPTGGGGGGIYIPPTTPPTTNIEDENPPLANVDGLNHTDHFAYITGYPDGTVQPETNITRAEAATIFFRLMTEEYRVANWATTNDFPDVKADEWYNVAISVAAKAGIVKGYPDGTFKPDESITRAEFATLAARFMTDDVTDDVGDFADTADHWAAETIRKAVKAGWVRGKSSTEFDPEANITRAEVVTMVNRMLDRCFVPDAAHMLDTMKTWSDNKDTSAWYYLDIQEAGNGHNYKMEENVETWTELISTDWAAKEAEWVANNGASAKTEK